MRPVSKRVTETELQKIEDALLRHTAGLSLMQLQKELSGSVSRRTLSRRISALLAAGRIHRRGEARSTRYVYGPAPALRGLHRIEHEGLARNTLPAAATTAPERKASELGGQFETPEGVVTIELSPVARHVLDYVSRPAAARRPCGYEENR